MQKYKTNEAYSKRIITSFEEGTDDMMMEDDEVMLEFKEGGDNKESQLFLFIKNVIAENVK